MKLVEQSIEIMQMTPNPELLWEQAVRTCYASHDYTKEGSAESLYRRIIINAVEKHDSTVEHVFFTFKLITDRGMMAQLTRHRMASFSIQSTRYCNYSKDKFGNEVGFLMPLRYKDNEFRRNKWLKSVSESEKDYMELLSDGDKAEDARSVLPTSTATEIVMSINLRSLRNFLSLRMDGHAQLEIQQISGLILNALEKNGFPMWMLEDVINQTHKKEMTRLKKENEELKEKIKRMEETTSMLLNTNHDVLDESFNKIAEHLKDNIND